MIDGLSGNWLEEAGGKIVLPYDTFANPQVHLTRTWLGPSYQPGPCWLCGKVCDLRQPGTGLVWAWEVPNEMHLACADRVELWCNSDLVKLRMLSLNVFMWRAFSTSHRLRPAVQGRLRCASYSATHRLRPRDGMTCGEREARAKRWTPHGPAATGLRFGEGPRAPDGRFERIA